MNIFILLNFFAIYCVFSSLLVSADQYYCSNKCECYLKGYNSNITEIFCSTKNNFKISLNIDTISELKYTAINISNITVLTVTCNNANDNYFENLASVAYKKIDQQMIEKLRILNCSLPDNKSFEEIFNKFQVENVTEIEYTIQEGNQERPFYIEYFEGMDKLNEISINFKKLSNSLSNIFHDSQGKDSAPLSNLDKYEMFNPIFENFYLNSTNDKMLIHLEMSQKIVVDIKCFNSKSQSNITIYATFPMTNSYPFIKIQLNNCKLPRKTNLLDILFSLYSKFENNQIYDVIIIDEKYIKQFLNEDFNNIAVIVKFSSRFNVISTFMELPILKIVNKTVSFEISIWKISGILLKDTSKYEYPGIKSLTIQRQFIKSSSKELFKDLHNIAELTLIENDISYLEHDFFEHLTNLIKLVISSNAFKKMSSEAFQNIPNLQVLESNNNRIMHNDIAIGFFKNMRYLKSIILTGHYAYGMSESIFYNFTSLTDISLNGNFHRNLNSNVFTRQRMMEKLNLNHNSIEILPDDIFKQNNKLKILRLSFNMFENISR